MEFKKYKAIFFDWDGTAVLSRKAPVDDIIPPMTKLLEKGVKLAIISGTTYENIAFGRLHELIPAEARKNLYLGLGRGVYNDGYNEKGELLNTGMTQLGFIHSDTRRPCRVPDWFLKLVADKWTEE